MKKGKVVVTGCFDLFHLGHLALLLEASTYGNVHILLNSDESCKALKGEGRPIMQENYRELFLKNLPFVESVQLFDNEEDRLKLIRKLNPKFYIRGKEKGLRRLPKGVQEIRIDRMFDISTTGIIERILKTYGQKG